MFGSKEQGLNGFQKMSGRSEQHSGLVNFHAEVRIWGRLIFPNFHENEKNVKPNQKCIWAGVFGSKEQGTHGFQQMSGRSENRSGPVNFYAEVQIWGRLIFPNFHENEKNVKPNQKCIWAGVFGSKEQGTHGFQQMSGRSENRSGPVNFYAEVHIWGRLIFPNFHENEKNVNLIKNASGQVCLVARSKA